MFLFGGHMLCKEMLCKVENLHFCPVEVPRNVVVKGIHSNTGHCDYDGSCRTVSISTTPLSTKAHCKRWMFLRDGSFDFIDSLYTYILCAWYNRSELYQSIRV